MKFASIILTCVLALTQTAFAQSNSQQEFLDAQTAQLTKDSAALTALEAEIKKAEKEVHSAGANVAFSTLLIPLFVIPQVKELAKSIDTVVQKGTVTPVDVLFISIDGALVAAWSYSVGRSYNKLVISSKNLAGLRKKVEQKSQEIDQEIKLIASIKSKLN